MELHFNTLAIERFRSLRQLTLTGLGRVNLITGRNNSGKSSVLEALRILASEASPYVLNDILQSREEDTEERIEANNAKDAEILFSLSSLFNGFPLFSAKLEPIQITASGGQRPLRLSIEAGWSSEERDANGFRRMVLQPPNLFGEVDGVPAIVVRVAEKHRLYPLDSSVLSLRGRLSRPEITEGLRLPCVFVSPYGGERTATLGTLWDSIALTDLENDIVDALRIIDHDISAVSMVGGESKRKMRTAIVRSARFPRPLPLRSFGDGLNRLFSIILSLVNAKDGLLLIDEFENGLHHTVQTDAWRMVFKLARRLNIQVMATSHSWDAIEAFQQAASEDAEEGVLVRLTRKGDNIIPTLFNKDQLAIATREHIEVR